MLLLQDKNFRMITKRGPVVAEEMVLQRVYNGGWGADEVRGPRVVMGSLGPKGYNLMGSGRCRG